MKKAIVIVVLLALMGGGALGGLGLMGMGPLADYVKRDAGSGAAPAAPAAPATRDIAVDTLGVPLFEGGAVRTRLFLNLQLKVLADAAPAVQHALPRLQSAFLEDMLQFMPYHLRDRAKIDPELVAQRLLKVARRVAGPDAVSQVVVTGSFER